MLGAEVGRMVKSNKQRAAKFKAENLKIGRKPRAHYTTLEEHEILKACLEKLRSGIRGRKEIEKLLISKIVGECNE